MQFKHMNKEIPAHNYAKPVPEFPKLRKQVQDALSNEFENQYNSYNDNQYKTYLISHNKAYYQGPWKKGLPQGKGKCVFSDGSYYEGNFEAGQADDENGFLILANGAIYKGCIRRSIIEGKGIMRQSVGNERSYIYNGSWAAGKPHGEGVQEYGDGSKYEGTFKEGLKHCFNPDKSIKEKEEEFKANGRLQNESRYQSASGEMYRGEFLNGRMHGFGDYQKKDTHISYTGQFFNGKKQGFGSLHTETGTLTGQFENDLVNGPGRYEWVKWSKQDGRVYVGNFKNSKFHGEGQIQLQNGNVLEGVWQDGHSIELKAVKSNRL